MRTALVRVVALGAVVGALTLTLSLTACGGDADVPGESAGRTAGW